MTALRKRLHRRATGPLIEEGTEDFELCASVETLLGDPVTPAIQALVAQVVRDPH